MSYRSLLVYSDKYFTAFIYVFVKPVMFCCLISTIELLCVSGKVCLDVKMSESRENIYKHMQCAYDKVLYCKEF